MALADLSTEEFKNAEELILRSCPLDFLESFLSEAEVLLMFQTELASLSKSERHQRLSQILVSVFGDQLLHDATIRDRICRSKRMKPPNTWRPGSREAVEFCQLLGLSAAFAGVRPPQRPSAVIRLYQLPELRGLFDYQQETVNRAKDLISAGTSALISLPTGSGKTRVATELLVHWHRSMATSATTLWIAHTEELCEQAISCITERWETEKTTLPAAVFRCWGNYLNQLTDGTVYDEATFPEINRSLHSIAVSTPQSSLKLLQMQLSDSSLRRALENPLLIVVDEAHRGAAQTYRSIYRLAERRRPRLPFSLLGLSATPVRATYASEPYEGTRELSKLFEKLIEPVETLRNAGSPEDALAKRGILAELRTHKLTVNIDEPAELAKVVAQIRATKPNNEPALFFSRTVAEAKAVASYLRDLQISSDYVSGASTWSERRRVIDSLRKGTIQVLCNCELLTTGFDAPRVGQIFVARPTRSPILYKQMIGRGLRGPSIGGGPLCDVYLCGLSLPFPTNPNTSEFARAVWKSA